MIIKSGLFIERINRVWHILCNIRLTADDECLVKKLKDRQWNIFLCRTFVSANHLYHDTYGKPNCARRLLRWRIFVYFSSFYVNATDESSNFQNSKEQMVYNVDPKNCNEASSAHIFSQCIFSHIYRFLNIKYFYMVVLAFPLSCKKLCVCSLLLLLFSSPVYSCERETLCELCKVRMECVCERACFI